jgi:nucleotide-binding universal stress UspA family protein
MFTRILVPLDGTPRAERALTVAARLARAADGTVLLFRAVGIPPEYSTYLYGPYLAQPPLPAEEVLVTKEATAKAYIETVRRSEKLAGVNVEAKVAAGAAALAIQEIACEEHSDLIVMCSHGDTGFKRWVLGSVAQSVSRACQVPVLVLREDGTAPDSAFPDPLRPLRSITALVALDGSQFAEAAITPTAVLVAALAAPAQGMLLLTRVVPLSALGNITATKELALGEAKTYLRQVTQKYADTAEKLRISLQTAVATGKEVADTLIRSAEQGDEVGGRRLTGSCDLIAITTHGRGGLKRLAMGSVTEHVLGATRLPLLVVHSPVRPNASEREDGF